MEQAVIPRRVHRIWIGPARMPALYVAHGRQWEAFGWPVLDWCLDDLLMLPLSDDTRAVLADIEERGAVAGGGIPAVAKWVQMADVFAYELVRCVGGIVANTDIEPLKDLGPLVDGLDGFVVGEDERFLSNALMGATPDHPFWSDLCAELPARFRAMRGHPMNQSTGPHHLTGRWQALGRPVARVEPCPFFPVHFDNEHRPERHTDGYWVDHRWGHRHPELLEV